MVSREAQNSALQGFEGKKNKKTGSCGSRVAGVFGEGLMKADISRGEGNKQKTTLTGGGNRKTMALQCRVGDLCS